MNQFKLFTTRVFITFLFLIGINACTPNALEEHKKYYPNGHLKESGHLLDDEKHGVWKLYEQQGDKSFLLHEQEYHKGKKHGIWISYDIYSKNKTSEIEYRSDQKSGSHSLYENGLPSTLSYYKKDQSTLSYRYSPNGSIESKATYELATSEKFQDTGVVFKDELIAYDANGKQRTKDENFYLASSKIRYYEVQTTYDSSGNTSKIKKSYGNSVFPETMRGCTEEKLFYPNKQLESLSTLCHSKLHGPFKEYWKNGNLKISTTFSHGIESGPRKEFNENGELQEKPIASQENNTNSEVHTGVSELEQPSANQQKVIAQKEPVDHGNKPVDGLYYMDFHKNGKPKSKIMVNPENPSLVKYNEFWSNGSIKEESFIKGFPDYNNEYKVGDRKLYYPNGNILLHEKLEEYKNDKGLLHSRAVERKEFFRNKQLHYEEYYKNGARHGTWKSYYRNGTLRRAFSYSESQKSGTWTQYDSNGSKVYEEKF